MSATKCEPILIGYNSILEVFNEFEIPLAIRETITIVSAVKNLSINYVDLIFYQDNKLYLVVAALNLNFRKPSYSCFLSKEERSISSLLDNILILKESRENLKIYFSDYFYLCS